MGYVTTGSILLYVLAVGVGSYVANRHRLLDEAGELMPGGLGCAECFSAEGQTVRRGAKLARDVAFLLVLICGIFTL